MAAELEAKTKEIEALKFQRRNSVKEAFAQTLINSLREENTQLKEEVALLTE